MLNKIIFDVQALNLASIAPMIIVSIFALAILCIGMIKKELSNRFFISLTILALISDLILVTAPLGNFRGVFNLVLMDGLAVFSTILIILSSIFFIVIKFDDNDNNEYNKSEFYTLFLLMIVGYQFMVSSDNLILIIVGLELSSLALYTLIAFKNTTLSVEAALKYFTMGAVATAFFVFGAAMLYLVGGSVEIHSIYNVIKVTNFNDNLTLYAGVMFLIVAIGFKVSLIPFHTWLPEIYEGSSTTLAGYISVVPKIAAFIVMLRIFNPLIISNIYFVEVVLYVVAVFTMSLANITALVQTNVKKMLAYSSISNAGFVLVAILIATTQATISIFLYWSMFAITNLGAFVVIWVIENNIKKDEKQSGIVFKHFSGLVKSSPLLALIMAIFMFSLAGIPPFSLFWGKIYLISSALSTGYIILAIIMVLNSAIAIYYYLKLIVYMFLKDGDRKIVCLKFTKYILIITALLTIFAPVVVEYIFSGIDITSMISFSGY